jgi:hypothetical protein
MTLPVPIDLSPVELLTFTDCITFQQFAHIGDLIRTRTFAIIVIVVL